MENNAVGGVLFLILLVVLVLLGGLFLRKDGGGMQISSSAFAHNQLIPEKYTCDGENVSPQLLFSGIPEGTRSLALIVDDPDASGQVWNHWLLWDIDPTTGGLSENVTIREGVEGTTSFGSVGYGGPCPPRGVHRYTFKLIALDVKMGLSERAKVSDLRAGMIGHIIEEAELVGLYTRDGK